MGPIECYQQKNDAGPLLNAFEPYLKKFYDLIRHQKMNYHNYDLRQFIKCYMKDSAVREELKRCKFLSNQTIKTVQEQLHELNQLFDSFYGSMVKDELYHELCYCLLTLAKRYEKKETSFETYVYHSFRFELKRRLDAIQAQQIKTMPYWDEYEQKTQDVSETIEQNDQLWIQGYYASGPFEKLRVIERSILYLKYILNKTDLEIGHLCGYHANYIGALRRKLINQLRVIQGV